MWFLDVFWYFLLENCNLKDEFLVYWILGVKFFDIDECVDKLLFYEYMLLKIEDFLNYVWSLGINNDSYVVVYDYSKVGLFLVFWVWWMFCVFGYDWVLILDGGFLKWKVEFDYFILLGLEDVVEIEGEFVSR